MLLGCEQSASQDGLSGRREGWSPEDLSQALCCRETLFYLCFLFLLLPREKDPELMALLGA